MSLQNHQIAQVSIGPEHVHDVLGKPPAISKLATETCDKLFIGQTVSPLSNASRVRR